MNCYEVLNIEPTNDIKAIKKAYARRSREFHPEEHPEEFKVLHDAYEEALLRAKWSSIPFSGKVSHYMGDTVPMFAEEEDTADGSGEELPDAQEEPHTEMPHTEMPEIKVPEIKAPDMMKSGEEQMWDARFEQIASAGNQNQGMTEQVRKVIGKMHELYMDETERGKLYHWKDFFDDPQLAEVFGSRAFFTEWYRFLQTHSLFTMQIWQYFASLDGSRFSGEPYGIRRFPYQFYIERMGTLRQEKAEPPEKKEPVQAPAKAKGISAAVKIALFAAILAGSALSSLLLGSFVGELLG